MAMIRVFFDDTEVNPNYIMKLTQTVNPYTQGFCLGSTICRQFSIDIHSAANVSTPDNVYLYEDNDSETQSDWSLYATLFVDSVETTDDNHITFNLTDIMVYFNTPLTYQGMVLSILNSICSDNGISLNTQDFYMKDYEVGEVSINERDLISYIAEVNGGYAYIDNNGNLNICRYENKAYSNIDSDMCSSIKVGAYHKIGRVSFDLTGTEEVYPSVTEYDTVSLNPDNIILQNESTRASIMKDVYSFIRGFAFYNIKIEKCPIDPDIRAGQLINVGGWRNLLSSGEEYITTLTGERILVSDGLLIPFLCEIDWNYNTQWLGGYTTDFENKTQEATPIVSVQEKVSKLKWELDDPTSGVKAQLELKVAKDDNDQIISMINASADVITLNSNRLIINSDNFQLTEDGTITCTNGNFSGTITGSVVNGTRINFGDLNNKYISATSSDYGVSFTGNGNYYVGTVGNIEFQNSNTSNRTNTIAMNTGDTIGNIINLINWRKDNTGQNNRANWMHMASDSSSNQTYIYTYDNDNNVRCEVDSFYREENGDGFIALRTVGTGAGLDTQGEIEISGNTIKITTYNSGTIKINGHTLKFENGYVRY